ncbi:succinyl-diaminopimelate desuccinylase, partial [Solemya velum gill symbiont]
GTVRVVETLEARNEKIDWCLVGEPSSTDKVGDVIKNGRRGSLNAKLTVHGKQGHVAYPHLAENPIHLAAPAIAELSTIEWDKGNDHFPPTSFQISNINGGTGATNVIPATVEMLINWRFSTENSEEKIRNRTTELFDRYGLRYELEWNLSGLPFLTAEGELVEAAQHAISSVAGYETQLSTSGGTSDGRFIAPTGAQVLELGPLNATIHQINECVSVKDLDQLSSIYEVILKRLLVV